jgi:spoIIIJ-associated protein
VSQSPDIDVPDTETDDATDAPAGSADPAGTTDTTDAADSGASADGSAVAEPDPAVDGAVSTPAPDAGEGDGEAEDEDRGEGVDEDDEADHEEGDASSDAESVDGDGDSAGNSSGRRATSVARLEREGEIAADFLEKLLDIADLDGDLDVDVEGERASVAIVDSADGRVPRRLVGQDGEVLEALQELSRLAVQARTGDRSRLMLDVAGHRARRREQLVAHAQEAVTKVKESGEPLRLDPMNPFERKIVHDAVAAAGLQSASEGVEPDRRIVVRPA